MKSSEGPEPTESLQSKVSDQNVCLIQFELIPHRYDVHILWIYPSKDQIIARIYSEGNGVFF